MQAAAQPAPSQGQARGESLLSRPASKSFFCQLLLGVTGSACPSPLAAPPHEDKKNDRPRPTPARGCPNGDWPTWLRPVRRPRNRGLDPLFVRAMTWTAGSVGHCNRLQKDGGSRSLIRQGNDLDKLVGMQGPELRKVLRLSRSLIRQGNDLDRRPPKSLRQKDLGSKNLKPLFSRTNVQRFRGVKIDKIMPQILAQ